MELHLQGRFTMRWVCGEPLWGLSVAWVLFKVSHQVEQGEEGDHHPGTEVEVEGQRPQPEE